MKTHRSFWKKSYFIVGILYICLIVSYIYLVTKREIPADWAVSFTAFLTPFAILIWNIITVLAKKQSWDWVPLMIIPVVIAAIGIGLSIWLVRTQLSYVGITGYAKIIITPILSILPPITNYIYTRKATIQKTRCEKFILVAIYLTSIVVLAISSGIAYMPPSNN